MNDLENENQRLRQENRELRDKEHKSHTAMKLIAFFGAMGICYAVEPHSQLAAAIIGIGAFYFCFMR
jgi:hypothetical protein